MTRLGTIIVGVLAAALVIGGGCGGGAKPVTKHYTLFVDGGHTPPGVAVTITVPGWDDKIDGTGSPTFRIGDGVMDHMFVVVIGCATAVTDDASCADAAVKLQFDGDHVKTEPGAGTTRWVTDDADVKGHKQVHLRRFVPDATHHRVVMCGALLTGDATARAADVRAACDSMVVTVAS